jgi:hypothetical protein
MPEKFGVAALSAWSFLPAATNSSMVVGTLRPDASNRSLRYTTMRAPP